MMANAKKPRISLMFLILVGAVSVLGQDEKPVERFAVESFQPDKHDIAGFVTRTYARQEAEVRRLSMLPENELPPGVSLLEEGAILKVKEEQRPNLLAIDNPLQVLLTHFNINLDGDGYRKSRLLAAGFPNEELGLIERARLPQYSLEHFKKQAYATLFSNFPQVVDATLEATDEDVLAYIPVYRKADTTARMKWTITTLEQFSPLAVQILLKHLEEPGNSDYQYYWRYNEDALLKMIRTTRQKHRKKLYWEKGVGPRSLNPPPFLYSDSGGPQWVRASAVSQDDNGEPIILTEGVQKNLFFQKEQETLARRFRRLAQERAIYKSGTMPDCPLTWPSSIGVSWEFEQLFPRSIAIFVAEVREITPGFDGGTPSSLLSVEIEQWIRKPLSGTNKVFYISYPNVRFQVGDFTFCAKDKRYTTDPFIGQRVLGFSTAMPNDADSLLLYIGPANLFMEDKLGNVQGFSLRSEEKGSFTDFVENVVALDSEWPFYKYIIGGKL